ncbi:helix-turn-helix domain-containing protein [Bacillus thuringiensis]|uniref:helix-turn-helix domain-containing protein n=1 Tax=Bacillus thuringiensis TaxID=1428 RepID=UPI0026E16950|nr:helix-turn-helix transcriptional regulator [Bacillus thuringiensis]MDO6630497.1 helix-turn-helix transcriptional regulator [Bacillus thuringiensis]MDO6660678.1 helix-turn-helix transcriptional regulator [Bacillus thuringiensis]MDO6700609.1 helix-turn-helix transcriptional regulator [Bacillus thuringiensis]
MITCNLKKVLVEKNLRITKVSKDTGISRTTLTALADHKNEGIRYDTLNKLLNYLQVGVEELVTYHRDEPRDVLNIQIESAVNTLKQLSKKETDICKKLDIDCAITVLTNKPHGRMPF